MAKQDRGTGCPRPVSPSTTRSLRSWRASALMPSAWSRRSASARVILRAFAGMGETTADFAEKAGRAALSDAGVQPKDVGLFIVATDTPEYISPATAILLQGRLQGGESRVRRLRCRCLLRELRDRPGRGVAHDGNRRFTPSRPGCRRLQHPGLCTGPATSSAGRSSRTAPEPWFSAATNTAALPGTSMAC